MGNKLDMLYRCVKCLGDITTAIDRLNETLRDIRTPQTVVDFHRVIWLDDTGQYLLIWYADGTGQILHVEGQIATLSTVARHGKTSYKLTDGRELVFPRDESKTVVE